MHKRFARWRQIILVITSLVITSGNLNTNVVKKNILTGFSYLHEVDSVLVGTAEWYIQPISVSSIVLFTATITTWNEVIPTGNLVITNLITSFFSFSSKFGTTNTSPNQSLLFPLGNGTGSNSIGFS